MHQTTCILFSPIGVTTCELTKTICRHCDLFSSICLDYISNLNSQEECYNAVNGITYVMAEYQVDTESCFLFSSTCTDFRYSDIRAVIMMTCASGTICLQYHYTLYTMQCSCYLSFESVYSFKYTIQ